MQNDIKRVLAYSTVSQLGYMFLACGVGAFAAGIFHLMTHAFFKALLFLGSGQRDPRHVRRTGHAQDGRAQEPDSDDLLDHGGCGAGDLAASPPFAGFFSKDEILWQSFAGPYGHTLLWAVGLDHRGPYGVLHVPPDLHDVLGQSRASPHEVEHHIHESPRPC